MPLSGAWHPKIIGAIGARPEDLVEQRELHLPVTGTAEVGTEVGRPQASFLDLTLQRWDQRVPELVAHERVREHVPERFDLVADELVGPVEVGLVLGVGLELPHGVLLVISARVACTRPSARASGSSPWVRAGTGRR